MGAEVYIWNVRFYAARLGAYQRRIVALQPWVLGHKAHPFLYSVLPYVDFKPH